VWHYWEHHGEHIGDLMGTHWGQKKKPTLRLLRLIADMQRKTGRALQKWKSLLFWSILITLSMFQNEI
jgi:hypothetical protein